MNQKTATVLRFIALCLMWGQMLGALAYSAIQHPIIKPFFTR